LALEALGSSAVDVGGTLRCDAIGGDLAIMVNDIDVVAAIHCSEMGDREGAAGASETNGMRSGVERSHLVFSPC